MTIPSLLRFPLAFLTASALTAQPAALPAPSAVTPAPAVVPAAPAEPRYALVIGNGAYKEAPLKTAVNDVRALASTLKGCGFQVTALENANLPKMRQALRDFGGLLSKGGVGFFYFAGYGMQVKGKNFLIPLDADIQGEDEIPRGALDVDLVLTKLESARNRVNILVLDACRSNPFARKFKLATPGLASVDAPMGTFVAYAAAPGRTVSDDREGNSLYTEQLTEAIKSPGLRLEDTFKRVLGGVRRVSTSGQMPWTASRVEGDFYFNTLGASIASTSQPAPLPVVVIEAGKAAGQRWKDSASGIECVWIPAGNFVMGGPWKGADDEKPTHLVAISHGFWMGKYEVTQGQYETVVGTNPSAFPNPQAPVEQVSWSDAKAFLKRLNQKTGLSAYRLPTEAEWEYACRAGRTGFDTGSLDGSAWYQDNAGRTTHPAGQKGSNSWGLFDMLGNVWEWCEDGYANYASSPQTDPKGGASNTQKVARGGGWDSCLKAPVNVTQAINSLKPNVYGAKVVSPSVRNCQKPDTRADSIGFRVVIAP